MRPARESGVVFGSEIMKKVKSSSAPFCEPVERDRQRLAEPERAAEDERQ